MGVPRFLASPVRVRVPATSANLGPGFDALGLAHALHDEVTVRACEQGLGVEVSGACADEVPRDERHLVVRSMRAAFAALGGAPPGLELRCANQLPHSRGLGSSAAAIVAGVLAARALVVPGSGDHADALDGDAALALASRLEGHPDNVAACLLGGATIAWQDEGGAGAVRVEPHPMLDAVLCVPGATASTEVARALLPDVVPHRDAAVNPGRAALLVHALAERPDLLLVATEDRLHQSYRAGSMPDSMGLVAALRAQGVPAVLSGAGPSVLALTSGDAQARVVGSLLPGSWQLLRPGLDREGAVVTPAA